MDLADEMKRYSINSGIKPDTSTKLMMEFLIGFLANFNKSLKEKCEFNSTTYQKNIIEHNKDFEIMIVGWSAGQNSSIHSHNGSKGAVIVVEGSGEEIIFTKNHISGLKKGTSHKIKAGTIIPISRKGIHQLKTEQEGKMITLHIYSPPIAKLEIYCEEGIK